MTLYMLDTDTCIYIMRNKPPIVEQRFKVAVKETLCISMVTLGELTFGVSRARFGRDARELVDDFTDRLAVIPWDRDAAWELCRASGKPRLICPDGW